MNIRWILLLALAAPVHAQSFGVGETDGTALPDFSLQVDELIEQQLSVEVLEAGPGEAVTISGERTREAEEIPVQPASVAVLRGLDKVSGQVTDFELQRGEAERLGRLSVELGECRVPRDNPTGDAFAFLTVRAEGLDRPVFDGWMIASSPALSALEHPRYDVWVIRCKSS